MKTNQIIQGDCLEVMKDILDNSIDLVITSPPYDNLRDYKGYSFDFESIAKELFRVIKQGGIVVWVVGDQTINGSETGTSFKQALYFKKIGFNLHDTMIWLKTTIPQSGNRYEPMFEYMFVFSRGKPKTFNPIKVKKLYKDNRKTKKGQRNKNGTFSKLKVSQSEYKIDSNVWKINTGGGIATKDYYAYKHPAIFPEKLASRHIKSWSNEGNIVLDPMNGSGTTTKMAYLLNRKYIGIDISKLYCEIAKQRLKQQILI